MVGWRAGIVSVLAALVAGSGSQARMLYDGGRSGPETPVNALIAMAVIGLAAAAAGVVLRRHPSTGPAES